MVPNPFNSYTAYIGTISIGRFVLINNVGNRDGNRTQQYSRRRTS